jgi:hypothetical protein
MMRLDLDSLEDASREALMSEWREVVGRPPPKHLSRPLMVQILSHTYQLDTVGGYTKRLDSRLKSAARRDAVRPAFKPGSRFVRECLSPLELCQYILAKGVRKHGSEAIF